MEWGDFFTEALKKYGLDGVFSLACIGLGIWSITKIIIFLMKQNSNITERFAKSVDNLNETLKIKAKSEQSLSDNVSLLSQTVGRSIDKNNEDHQEMSKEHTEMLTMLRSHSR